MTRKNDKPNYLNFNSIWVIILFFLVNRFKVLFIIINLLTLSPKLICQCKNTIFFKEKIGIIYNSSTLKVENQLKELLILQQQMKECHLDKDSVYMFLLQKIGVLYFKQSNYLNAIIFTNESINLAKNTTVGNSYYSLALLDNYYNLFYYYREVSDLKKKYNAIDSCIFYALKSNSSFDKAITTLTDKTEYLYNRGDYNLCIINAKLGENIVEQHYHEKDSIDYIVFFIIKQVNAYYFSNNISLAENLLNSKIEQFQRKGDSRKLHAFFSLLGLINRDRKDYISSLSYFQKALQASLLVKYNNGCAQNLGIIGTLYSKAFNQQNIGLKYCANALKYADTSDSLFILKEIGNIYVLKGMYDKAQYFFKCAFNTIQIGVDENNILQSSFLFPGFSVLQNLLELITEKGNAYLQQYYHTKNIAQLNTAVEIYKKADLFLAKIKADQQLQLESNLVWMHAAHNLYEQAIEACYLKKDIENAFYFFEKSRAILLNDQINEQRWMADEDIAQQAQLKKDIAELQSSFTNLSTSSKEYGDIQKKLYNAEQALDVLLRNIKSKNPLFYQDYLDTSFITVMDLKEKILKNSKSLVEIFSGDSAAYVLTITPNNKWLIKINKQLYDSITNVYISFITLPALLNKNYDGFIKIAQQLYQLIFQNNIPPNGSIIISPDGKNFPFESLVTNNNNQQPNYFLNNYATSYTYSAKYLTNQFALASATINVLGIAPVNYKNNTNLATLTGSDNSLLRIKNYCSDVTNYTYQNATRHNFLQNFSNYGIIQFYTHATDTSNKKDPVIYFSDSALYLSELIAERKPVTQLVILSACETANGTQYKGEGIFSFNRGFAAMGIPAAISNLWSVDNESTYAITELFYKYLQQGFSTDIALQKAKQHFISSSTSKEKKLPYYWAGPILTGRVDTLKTDKNNTVPFLFAEFLIAIIATVGYSIMVKKKQLK